MFLLGRFAKVDWVFMLSLLHISKKVGSNYIKAVVEADNTF